MERPPLFGAVRSRSSRLTAIAVAVVLHALLVMALLAVHLAGAGVPLPTLLHETELVLPLPQMARVSTARARGAEKRGTATVPNDLKSPFLSPVPQAGVIGQALFGCALDHLGDLPPEERAKCNRMTGLNYTAFADQPIKLPPLPEKLRNSDIAAREHNTADRCLIAKQSGTECIHELLFDKGLP